MASTSEIYRLLVLKDRRQKSRCPHSHGPSETCRGVCPCLVLASGGLQATSGLPWLVDTSVQFSVFTSHSLCVPPRSVFLQRWRLYRFRVDATLIYLHLNFMNCIYNSQFPNKVTFCRYWGVRTSTVSFLGSGRNSADNTAPSPFYESLSPSVSNLGVCLANSHSSNRFHPHAQVSLCPSLAASADSHPAANGGF